MRIVLLGDSHLARVRRDLDRLRCTSSPGCETRFAEVHNAAVGGASAADLEAQAAGAGVRATDRVAVCVGTNDALPWKQVALRRTEQHVRSFLASVRPERLVYVTPFGVQESRLDESGAGTNTVMQQYGAALSRLFEETGAVLVDGASLLAPLGAHAFDADGVHLSARGYDAVLPALCRALCGSTHE